MKTTDTSLGQRPLRHGNLIDSRSKVPAAAGVSMLRSSAWRQFSTAQFHDIKFADLCAEITTIHKHLSSQSINGKVATYIPQLAKVKPSLFGIAICTTDGRFGAIFLN
jgi:hypothetical protein